MMALPFPSHSADGNVLGTDTDNRCQADNATENVDSDAESEQLFEAPIDSDDEAMEDAEALVPVNGMPGKTLCLARTNSENGREWVRMGLYVGMTVGP